MAMKKSKKVLISLLCVLLAAAIVLTVVLVVCLGDKKKYTFTFETNGGTEIAPYTLSKGDKIERPADPEKDLFTFSGWYADEALTEMFTFGQKMPAHDVTVYAAWASQKSSRVVFNANGGGWTDEEGQTSVTQSEVGIVGSAFRTPADPVYEGYRFGGWCTDEGGEQPFTSTAFPEESLTLYARWDRDPSYAYITYMGNGDRIGLIPVKKGEPVTEPQFFGGDIETAGWCTDQNLTNRYEFGGAAANDVTLYTSYWTRGLEISGSRVVRYNGDSANVVIPNLYGGQTVIEVGDGAFAEKTRVVSVDLPDTVGRIGNSAFYRCDHLATINLNQKVALLGSYAFFGCSRLASFGDISGVTSIPEGLFVGCVKLTAVTLSENTTAIGAQAFADCSALTEIVIPDRVTALSDGVFDGCTALEKVALPASLNSFGSNVFTGCANLKELTLPESNTAFDLTDGALTRSGELLYFVGAMSERTAFTVPDGITRIVRGAFDGNATIEEITVGNGVNITCGALSGMKALRTLTVPALGGGAGSGYLAYYFGAARAETSSLSGYLPETLQTVTLTGSPTAVADYAFIGAAGLREVNGLENVTSVGKYAFAYTGLRTFAVAPTLTAIGEGAFTGCGSLLEFTMEGSSTAFSVHEDCLYNGNGTTLLAVPSAKTAVSFPDTIETIESYAFSASMVEEVVIPASVQSIGFAAFSNCASIRRITVPYIGDNARHNYLAYIFGAEILIATNTFDGEVRKSISPTNPPSSIPRTLEEVTVDREYTTVPDGAFALFPGLKKVNFTGSTITGYGAFSFYQTGVEEMDFTGVDTIGDGAFRETALTSVSLPSTLTSFGYAAFALLADLESIELAEGITEIAPLAFNAYAYTTDTITDEEITAFRSSVDCRVVIPSTVQKIGTSAFYGVGMTYDGEIRNVPNEHFEIVFAETGGTTALTEIGVNAFACSSLRTIALPATVRTVGENAFSGCTALRTVTFGTAEKGSALQTLGSLCFEGCTALQSLTMYAGSVVTMTMSGTRDIFDGASEEFTVYVTAETLEAFRTAAGWSKYAQKIVAVEGGAN